ncbi:MAG: 3-deoxy-7-phosphoheptulonate synthase [Candidatus Berkiellales bacterium]
MRDEYQNLKNKMDNFKVGNIQKPEIRIGKHVIGDNSFTLIAGPCAVEDRQQMTAITEAVVAAGAHILRGGAFKPRTSPYSFQGLGEDGLLLLKEMRDKYHIPIITEVMDARQIENTANVADVLQIGSRNMQNFGLLEAAGYSQKPILLKRGIAATIEELLMAAEYILNTGNHQVMLCERGIRTFEKVSRNTLDLNAVAILKNLTHLPIIVDPSHGTGITQIMSPMAKAALACGADGIMVEVHHQPSKALSDGDQALLPAEFKMIVADLFPLAKALNRGLIYV